MELQLAGDCAHDLLMCLWIMSSVLFSCQAGDWHSSAWRRPRAKMDDTSRCPYHDRVPSVLIESEGF